jgi:hypothetical protein
MEGAMKLATSLAFLLASSVTLPALAQDGPPPAAPPPEAAPPPMVAAPPPPPMLVAPPPGGGYVDAPSSGLGLLITGGVFTGLGVINLATAPICKADTQFSPDTQNVCLIASLAVGGTFLAVGVPLLIVGAGKRSTYNAWRAEHPVASGFGYQPVRGGGGLGFSTTF